MEKKIGRIEEGWRIKTKRGCRRSKWKNNWRKKSRRLKIVRKGRRGRKRIIEETKEGEKKIKEKNEEKVKKKNNGRKKRISVRISRRK